MATESDDEHGDGGGGGSELMGIGMEAAMEVVQGGGSSSGAAAAAAAAVTSAGGEEADAIAAAGTAAAFTAAMKGLSAQEAATVAAAAATAAGGSHLDAGSAAGAAASSVVSARGGSAAEASEAASEAQAKLGLLEEASRKRCRADGAAAGETTVAAAPATKRRRCFSAEELCTPASLPLETDDEEVWLRGEALPSIAQLQDRYFTTKKKRHRWGTAPSLRWAYKADPYERRCVGCKACIRWQTAIAGDATGMPQYEVFNADHIKALAAYFIKRMGELGLPALSVVEVGAGDGRFSHFLRVALAKSDAAGADRVTITATDDNSRQLEQFYAVEACDAAEVMSRFKPDIVLVSWMELGQDWTSTFRSCASVQEYVLVGEVDNGACGHPWKTWGHSFIRHDTSSSAGGEAGAGADAASGRSGGSGKDAKPEDKQPPYAAEGFERVELEELSALQLNHFDEPWQKHMPRVGPDGQLQPWRSWSHTVSFRRQAADTDS